VKRYTHAVPLHPEDRDIVERVLASALRGSPESQEIWAQFLLSLSHRLDAIPNTGDGLIQKASVAGFLLAALLRNCYPGDAGAFYWQAGELRKTVFRLAESLGVHLLPVHFYSPVPAVRQLDPVIFSRRSELPGIDLNEAAQLALLSTFAEKFRHEYDRFPMDKPPGSMPHTFFVSNGYYQGVDAEILYCMVRHFKPRRILEIGSGYSTYLSAASIARNSEEDTSYRCELVAIEPFPNEVLAKGFPGLTRLIPKRVQEVPWSEFQRLEENDILFIDSSHVLKIGSDVQYEYLEILPRLQIGVLVHVHDVFLPLEYPADWVLQMNRYWTEQYLLQAFLAFNRAFAVVVAGSWLHATHPDVLESTFRTFKHDQARRLGFFWMRRSA